MKIKIMDLAVWFGMIALVSGCGKNHKAFSPVNGGEGSTALYGSSGEDSTQESNDDSTQEPSVSSSEPLSFHEAMDLMERVEHKLGGIFGDERCTLTDSEMIAAIKTGLQAALDSFQSELAITTNPERQTYLKHVISRTLTAINNFYNSLEYQKAVLAAQRLECQADQPSTDAGSDSDSAHN